MFQYLKVDIQNLNNSTLERFFSLWFLKHKYLKKKYFSFKYLCFRVLHFYMKKFYIFLTLLIIFNYNNLYNYIIYIIYIII